MRILPKNTRVLVIFADATLDVSLWWEEAFTMYPIDVDATEGKKQGETKRNIYLTYKHGKFYYTIKVNKSDLLI